MMNLVEHKVNSGVCRVNWMSEPQGVSIKMISYNVTSCNLVNRYRYPIGTCYLHLQDRRYRQ